MSTAALAPRGLSLLWSLASPGTSGPSGRPGSSGRSAGSGPPDGAEGTRIAALVTLAQQGDAEAFGSIYDAYVDMIYRYLYYRVGSAPLAEDLTSETFLRALRRLESFSWQGKDIGAWFVTIARNLVADHVKSARYRLEVPTGELLDADRGDDGIEQEVLDRLQSATLIEAVRRLKPEHQECVVLRFFEELSVSDTARVLGRTEGAVKQLQLRAIRALGRLLEEQPT